MMGRQVRERDRQEMFKVREMKQTPEEVLRAQEIERPTTKEATVNLSLKTSFSTKLHTDLLLGSSSSRKMLKFWLVELACLTSLFLRYKKLMKVYL